MNNEDKIAIFDLDETIGYFSQLFIIWKSLIILSKKKLNLIDFYKLCDIYSCYFRPEIIEIMLLLRKNNIQTVIYTNNIGPKWWAQLIAMYINYKTAITLGKSDNLSINFIDTVIGAFKINGLINDNRRTTNEKTYKDIERIFNLTSCKRVMFVDDLIHEKMIEKNVFYLRVPVYKNNLPLKKIIDLFFRSQYGKYFILKNEITLQFFINFLFVSLEKNVMNYEYYIHNKNNLFKMIKRFVNM